MKKTFTVVALLLSVSILKVQAQKKSDINFGVRAGANFSNVIKDGDKNFSTAFKPGFNAAFFLELPIIKEFSVQPELQYAQKGYKATGTILGSPYEYRVTTSFIEIPIVAKFKTSKQFSIVAGPQYSFLTATNTKFITSNSTLENNVKHDNDNLKKNLLGGLVGFEINTGNSVLNFRYSLDLQSNNGDGTSTTPKYKNQVLGLSLGFKF